MEMPEILEVPSGRKVRKELDHIPCVGGKMSHSVGWTGMVL
jgi:hypothetical protein